MYTPQVYLTLNGVSGECGYTFSSIPESWRVKENVFWLFVPLKISVQEHLMSLCWKTQYMLKNNLYPKNKFWHNLCVSHPQLVFWVLMWSQKFLTLQRKKESYLELYFVWPHTKCMLCFKETSKHWVLLFTTFPLWMKREMQKCLPHNLLVGWGMTLIIVLNFLSSHAIAVLL